MDVLFLSHNEESTKATEKEERKEKRKKKSAGWRN